MPSAQSLSQAEVVAGILAAFDDVHVVESGGDTFFFQGANRQFPFATLVASDSDFDHLSRLDRADVFRLNLGLTPPGFAGLFGDSVGAHWDYTALDRLMPHPMYGRMHWVCVLNPSARTFESLQVLIAEAHELAVRQQARRPGSAVH